MPCRLFGDEWSSTPAAAATWRLHLLHRLQPLAEIHEALALLRPSGLPGLTGLTGLEAAAAASGKSQEGPLAALAAAWLPRWPAVAVSGGGNAAAAAGHALLGVLDVRCLLLEVVARELSGSSSAGGPPPGQLLPGFQAQLSLRAAEVLASAGLLDAAHQLLNSRRRLLLGRPPAEQLPSLLAEVSVQEGQLRGWAGGAAEAALLAGVLRVGVEGVGRGQKQHAFQGTGHNLCCGMLCSGALSHLAFNLPMCAPVRAAPTPQTHRCRHGQLPAACRASWQQPHTKPRSPHPSCPL